MVIKQRNQYAKKIEGLMKKYVPDKVAANALITNYQDLIVKSNKKLEEESTRQVQ